MHLVVLCVLWSDWLRDWPGPVVIGWWTHSERIGCESGDTIPHLVLTAAKRNQRHVTETSVQRRGAIHCARFQPLGRPHATSVLRKRKRGRTCLHCCWKVFHLCSVFLWINHDRLISWSHVSQTNLYAQERSEPFSHLGLCVTAEIPVTERKRNNVQPQNNTHTTHCVILMQSLCVCSV